MTPAEGGRICGGCNKLITDFTKMRWAEIEKLQAANNNALCGMYTKKQLQHWGHEVPQTSCSKIAATAALFLSLAGTLSGHAQTTDTTRTVIYGKVTDDTGEPAVSATVVIQGTEVGTVTDLEGNYRLDVTNLVTTANKPVIEYRYIGYKNIEFTPAKNIHGQVQHNAQFKETVDVIAFAVYEPTMVDDIRHSIKKAREKRRLKKERKTD